MIKLQKVSKKFQIGKETIFALQEVDLEIKKGEFVAIIGTSGSGKSTLLNLMGLLDKPTSGKVTIDNQETKNFSDNKASEYRQKNIGFIFQDFFLIKHLNILENTLLSFTFSKTNLKTKTQKAKKALKDVGLESRINHKPTEISGGQKERAAIARAIANNPAIILADEPTGNLDSLTAKKILKLFKQLHKNNKHTIIIVTHDPLIAEAADRIIEISDGKIK